MVRTQWNTILLFFLGFPFWIGCGLQPGAEELHCQPGEPCLCEGPAPCVRTCNGPSCAMECRGPGSCTLDCWKGGCSFMLASEGWALLLCDGGRCTAESTGAGSTELRCAGGDCALHCSGSGECALCDCDECVLECRLEDICSRSCL